MLCATQHCELGISCLSHSTGSYVYGTCHTALGVTYTLSVIRLGIPSATNIQLCGVNSSPRVDSKCFKVSSLSFILMDPKCSHDPSLSSTASSPLSYLPRTRDLTPFLCPVNNCPLSGASVKQASLQGLFTRHLLLRTTSEGHTTNGTLWRKV